MQVNQKVMQTATELQTWVDTFRGLREVVIVSLTVSEELDSISINDTMVWNSDEGYDSETLTLTEHCKMVWLNYCQELSRFLTPQVVVDQQAIASILGSEIDHKPMNAEEARQSFVERHKPQGVIDFCHPKLVKLYGSWARVQVEFYDFLHAQGVRVLAQDFNQQAVREAVASGEFSDGESIYETAVKAIEEKWKTPEEAWADFLKR